MKQAVLIRKIRKYVTAITIVISVMTMAGCESEDEEYVGWLPNQEGWCEGPKNGWFTYTASENYFSGQVYISVSDSVIFTLKEQPEFCNFDIGGPNHSLLTMYIKDKQLAQKYTSNDIIHFKMRKFRFIKSVLYNPGYEIMLAFEAVVEVLD